MEKHGAVPGFWGIPAWIGALGGLLSVPILVMLPHGPAVIVAGVMLAGIGAIYIGFALQTGTVIQIATEISVALLCVGAGLFGIFVSQWAIIGAYVAHGCWDTLHHGNHRRFARIPLWYPPFCAVADWVIAVSLAVDWGVF